MIRAHEIPNHSRSYWVEESRQGNGLAVGALSTAIPALSYGGQAIPFAREMKNSDKEVEVFSQVFTEFILLNFCSVF